MQRRTIAKRSLRGKQPTKKPEVEADDPEECPVCLYAPKDRTGRASKWVAFPCCHKTCAECFERCERCPICRCGKDGELGIVQQERSEREAAQRRQEPTPALVAFFRGGSGHPFGPDTLSVRVSGLATPAMSIIPEVLAAINSENASGRRMTHGQRQQRAAQILRFENGAYQIMDILGREIPRRSQR